MKSKLPASRAFTTTVALGATAAATTAQAAVTFQTFNLTSGAIGEGIGIGYNFTTFSLSNTGEQFGSVMARSGYFPGKGFVSSSFLNGDYRGGPNQAKVSSASVSFGATIDSSLNWSSRINISQGLGDTYYGIRFDNGGGNFSYGWLDLKTPGNNVTFVSSGVEQSLNTGIRAGSTTSIPEPSSAAVFAGLAGGAVALTNLRRRRKVA
jgi:hypothetical protein